MKVIKVALIYILFFNFINANSQDFFEGFETVGTWPPEGWTQEYESGTQNWLYRNGGHDPEDPNWNYPPDSAYYGRNPESAFEGTYNAIFFKQSENNERTKLITPELNLSSGENVQLSFYLYQEPWISSNDVLRIYYRLSESSNWVLLKEYLDPVYPTWEKKTLMLPSPSENYYVAFEGHTKWGYGTCIDSVYINEVGLTPLYIKSVEADQSFFDYVPSGASNVPVMRMKFRVAGNTGSVYVENMEFTSLNVDDNDLTNLGVKLYSTTSSTFNIHNPVGTAINFNDGVATFTSLHHSLPSGISYMWITYDVDLEATHGNKLDVKLEANSIYAGGSYFPSSQISPAWQKTIYSSLYSEYFESATGWALTGEFEIATPGGLGGTTGNPDPEFAYSGTKVLGTDLTSNGDYESNISEELSYLAVSPNVNVFYYKNLNLFFQRHLNIDVNDSVQIHVSNDDGLSWNRIWGNKIFMTDYQWEETRISIPDEYARSENFKVRYKLGPTNEEFNYSGWNIDDMYLTGEFISRDVGVSEWVYPQSGSGHSSNDSVRVIIRNYGGADITDDIPVSYSFDGGFSWTTDIMTDNILIGGSISFTFPTKTDLSQPGLRPLVLAKTELPGDQYSGNDEISTEIYIVPTYTPPYSEDFETNEGFWNPKGKDIWEYGNPGGSVINVASSGVNSWVTGLGQKYGDMLAGIAVTAFEDEFDTENGWTFEGEFERAEPFSEASPFGAYYGSDDTYCIGTDLDSPGEGTTPYNYEDGITEASAYTATSPSIDVLAYSNLVLGFQNWIGIMAGDSIKLEISRDNGSSWKTIWENNGQEIIMYDWDYQEIEIPDSFSVTTNFRIKFSLFHSNASGNAEGWIIDALTLTGTPVDNPPAYLESPSFDLTGIEKPVIETRIWTDTEQDIDGATLYYSLDDGNSWTAITNTEAFDDYWNWYSGKYVIALGIDGWSGQSGQWITAKHLMPSSLIGKDNVWFRFEFEADKINNYHDGIAVDDISIYEAPHDVGVVDIIAPVTACELSANESFSLSLHNYGARNMQAGDSIKIGYYIERDGIIHTADEVIYLTETFGSSTTKTFNFSEEFDFGVSGQYNVDVFTIEDDPYFYYAAANDTLSRVIGVNKPYVDLGPDISTVRPDTIMLDASSGIGGQTYKWQDNSPDSTYNVSTQGTYYVEVSNVMCTATDTVEILQLIADVGVSQFISPYSACELGNQVPIKVWIKNFGTDILDESDTIIVNGSINGTNDFSDTIHLTTNFYPGDSLYFTFTDQFNFSVPDIYNLELYTEMTNDFVYNDNDTLNYVLEVYGYPYIGLGNDTTVVAAEYLLEASPGYYSYEWQDLSTNNTFLVDQPGSDLYSVTVSNDHGCTSYDDINVTLNVIDVAMDEILSPATACGLNETITVSIRVSNTGNITIPASDSIFVGYIIELTTHVKDTIVLENNFEPGNSIDFTFSQTENVALGNWYDFEVYAIYKDDIKSDNDTIDRPIGIFETPGINLGNDTIVQATEYILDAGSGYKTYEWQDQSTDQTFTVTKMGIGTYSVTVTNDNDCPASDTIQVMLAVPDIGILELVNPYTSCMLGTAENVQLGIKNFGSYTIPSSSTIEVEYSLNGGPDVIEAVPLTADFMNGDTIYYSFTNIENFSLQGNYQLRVNTLFGTDLIPSNDTLNASVDIYGLPAVNIGDGQDTILTYEPISLTAPAGLISYEWQDGNSNPFYTISEPGAGMYTVLVTDINFCSTLDSVYVAYDLPDLELSRFIDPVSSCELQQNNPVSIEIVNNGYYRILTDSIITISYSVNNETSVSEEINLSHTLEPEDSITVHFSTTYDFSNLTNYQLNAGINYSADENFSNDTIINEEVNVWGYPDVEIGGGQDTMITDLPVTLNAGAGYASYLWQNGSVSSNYAVYQDGLYWVLVTDNNGCSDGDSVYVETLVFKEDMLIDPDKIRIYPNPADDFMYIQVDMKVEMEYVIELYTILNSLVYRKDLNKIQLVETEIDVHGLVPGTYILKITADKVPHTYLVVVK